MASEIKVDTIVNAGGDNDSGIDLATNDNIKFDIAGSQKAIIDASGNVGIGTTSPETIIHATTSSAIVRLTSDTNGTSGVDFGDSGDTNIGRILYDNSDNSMRFTTNASERMRIDSNGNISIGKTSTNASNAGVAFEPDGIILSTHDGDVCAIFNRNTNDGRIIDFRQANTDEGNISVSGSTISYNGFSGLHESSGIATDTPIGTVVSTIDELDVYSTKQGENGREEDCPRAGQVRADHAKVKVSDTAGDKAVYGVVGSFNAQGKVNVASVGIGSVRVTGACAKGDLLESNGDGTAKVQSDDIVRSKTIGKVTIGNSNTGVKLVSCVLYCG